MQQELRPFDVRDPTYTTEDFLDAIAATIVMTAGPEQTNSPYHEAWILKEIAMIQTSLGALQNNGTLIYHKKLKRTGKRFAENFRRDLITNN